MSEEGKGLAALDRRTFTQASVAVAAASVLAVATRRAQEARAEETGEVDSAGGNPLRGTSYTQAPDPVPEDEIVETVDADIVIVGAGVAGMAGILYASAQGANVHVLEKGPHEGVHRLSLAGINSKYNASIPDYEDHHIPVENYVKNYMRCTAGVQSKTNLVSRYAKDSGKWIDWLSARMLEKGWQLLPCRMTEVFTDDMTWPDYEAWHFVMDPDGNNPGTGVSPNWMKLFHEMADEYGAHFHFDEPGYYLERDGESGRVTGVISYNYDDGAYRRYNAKLGVLLAAGDFYNDKEMVHRFGPHLERCVTSICEPNNTGDMHKAGIWVGAAMDDYTAGDLFAFQNAACKNYVGPAQGDPDWNPLHEVLKACIWVPAMASYPLLWVDDGGRRFVNEDQNCFQQAGGQAILTTPTGLAWTIYDSAWESKMPEDWATNIPGGMITMAMSANTQAQIDKEVEEGLIQKYDTLEELAAGCGFDWDTFSATVERYNYLCDQGYDEDCFKSAKWLSRLDTPPYYAAHWGCMITSTRCGLKTDEFSHVLDTKGKVIPGLYAAGNNGGNFYGLNYPGSFGGTGIGHGQFFSWTAVRDMLGEDVIYTDTDWREW